MEDLLKVGVITTTHGVRGEVKVYPTTDPERFPELDYVLLDTGREKRKLEIEKVRFFKNLVILKFKGIDNINDIEMYKQRELWIPREEGQDLEEDEYYIADLIGMKVVLEDGSSFGTLTDVMETGANDVCGRERGRSGDSSSGHQGMHPGCGCGEKCDDHPSDERINLNEFSCFNTVSGNDRKWYEYQYHRPGHCQRTSFSGSH